MEEFAPENFGGSIHAQSPVGISLLEVLELFFFREAFEGVGLSSSHEETRLPGADAEAKLNGLDPVFGRSLFKDFHLVAPLALFAPTLPFRDALVGPLSIGNDFEKLRVIKIPLLEGMGEVIPKL